MIKGFDFWLLVAAIAYCIGWAMLIFIILTIGVTCK